MFALGEVYLRQNKTDAAEKILVQGLAIDDQSYLGHLNLARVYWERARVIKDLAQARPPLEKAYEEVKRALSLRPDLAGAHLLKGNLLLRVSRAHDALVEFDEYLRLEPNGPFAAETRALVERIRKATAGAH
jgi:tetratricopeptide (TPR) repeat protein